MKFPDRSKTPKRLRIDPADPDTKTIGEAKAALEAGGLIVFPTRSLYGLGVDAFNPQAVQALFKVKGRPADKPILILIRETRQLASLVQGVPEAAEVLMQRFWPGRLTLVFSAAQSLPNSLTAQTGKIGIRLAGHPVAAALAAALGRPVTGTSANLSGRPGIARLSDLDPAIGARADLILDAGPLKGGPGSTVVDVTRDPPEVLREGEISALEISSALG